MVFKTIEGKKEEKKNEDIVNYNLYGNMEPLSSKPNFKTGDLKVLVCFRGDICILSPTYGAPSRLDSRSLHSFVFLDI